MSTQLIRPPSAKRLEIRCNVGDAIVANLATHVVFFYERHLDLASLVRSFTQALATLPVFAGRTTLAEGRMRIRCTGQGVPFTSASSDRTLGEAIRSVSDDTGGWLIDPVNGVTARWGWGPLCKVRVTYLVDGATAIGLSWHHVVGDMQTLMIFMNSWAAADSDEPIAEPLLVEDRAAYLDQRLPADGAGEPGVRCLGLAELARSAVYLTRDARRQRTLTLYFGDDELARMRSDYGHGMRLSANDVVCGHVSAALMEVDPAVERRTLAIAVNVRRRCGLEPMLVGNLITTLHVDLRRGQAARSIAEGVRHAVDHFSDEHCDMRINQRFLDNVGPWRAARCVSTAFNPSRWNPLVTNLSGFGVYRVKFQGAVPSYCTLLLKLPVAGLGALMEGTHGRGLVFQMALPPKEFQATSSPEIQERLHRFRHANDDIPRLHREVHG
ncbi:MAG: hypothetical protein QOJ95_717 [Mycobacterium sp.]|jgi:hypothetical protein|nr:hypothetical protein [Mycobacterium sp.]